jgi:putative membrane protein
MKPSLLTVACLSICSLLLVPITRASAADVSSSDKAFITKASQGGMTEVEAGKLAQEKGASQDVKDFGAMMVKDHTQNNSDLMTLAKAKGVDVSDKLDSMHQGMIDKMSKLSGAAFDKAYVNDMVKGHTKMLKLMKGEESSKDADLKDFATKTSDTVQMHLTKAEDIQKSLK